MAVHRLLPVPTIYHSHAKTHEIFSFTLPDAIAHFITQCLIRHNHYHSLEHSPVYISDSCCGSAYDLSLSSNILSIINTITQSTLVRGRESEVVGVDCHWLL